MQRHLIRVAVFVMGFAAARGADAQSTALPPLVTYPGLSARIEAPTSVRLGDDLALRFVVRNDTDRPVRLPLTREGDFAFDPIARDANGRIVWRRLSGQYLSAVGAVRIIPPHETTTYRATWNLKDQSGLRVPPGTYRIIGRLIGGTDSVILSVADVQVVITR